MSITRKMKSENPLHQSPRYYSKICPTCVTKKENFDRTDHLFNGFLLHIYIYFIIYYVISSCKFWEERLGGREESEQSILLTVIIIISIIFIVITAVISIFTITVVIFTTVTAQKKSRCQRVHLIARAQNVLVAFSFSVEHSQCCVFLLSQGCMLFQVSVNLPDVYCGCFLMQTVSSVPLGVFFLFFFFTAVSYFKSLIKKSDGEEWISTLLSQDCCYIPRLLIVQRLLMVHGAVLHLRPPQWPEPFSQSLQSTHLSSVTPPL